MIDAIFSTSATVPLKTTSTSGEIRMPVLEENNPLGEIVMKNLPTTLPVAAAGKPRRFFPMQGIGHNDPLPPEFFASLRQFLNAYAPL